MVSLNGIIEVQRSRKGFRGVEQVVDGWNRYSSRVVEHVLE